MKLNGHHIFIGICVVISALGGFAKQEFAFGMFMFAMLCGGGYFYYWIYLWLKNSKAPEMKLNPATAVVGATIIDSGTKYKTKGGLGSAVVGGALFGEVGAVVGATVGQKTTEAKTVRFLVEYKDGHKKIEDVKVDSARYKQLINFIK